MKIMLTKLVELQIIDSHDFNVQDQMQNQHILS